MIGFTGPYSDVNFGDYAMLVNNVYTIGIEDVTLFVYDRPFLEKISHRYFSEHRVKMVEVRMTRSKLDAMEPIGFTTPAEMLAAVENLNEIREAITDLDVLYVNGGGYLNSLWARPHRFERLIQIIVPALVAETLNVPIKFTANGYGPFRGDEEMFASIFGFLQNAQLGVRDSILSPYWLSRVGVNQERVADLPDDLLLIEESLSSDVPLIDDDYVIIETYLPMEYLEREIGAFEAFVETMRDEYDCHVLFLPFHLGHGGVDQGEFLAGRIPNLEVFDITDRGFLPIEDAVSLVRQAKLVVSSRYHAVILALGTGTPIISVLKDVLGDKQYYHGKNVGALRGVLSGAKLRLEDYFFTDYAAALRTASRDFLELTGRQRAAHEAVAPGNFDSLTDARHSYFGVDR